MSLDPIYMQAMLFVLVKPLKSVFYTLQVVHGVQGSKLYSKYYMLFSRKKYVQCQIDLVPVI